MKKDYLQRKMDDIEAEIAIAVGVASMVGCMFGKCTDEVIKSRDDATRKVQKIVMELLKVCPTKVIKINNIKEIWKEK